MRISTEETKELIFRGDEHSLVFATDRSVRAISGGAPVIVRYVFVPSERLLYYAEIPLDPYHGDILDKFIEMKPADSGSLPRFYPTPMDSFSLSFGQGEEKAGVTKSWDDPEAIPLLVLVNWSRDGGATSSTQLMIPNSFFPRKIKEDKVVSPSEAGNQGLAPDR